MIKIIQFTCNFLICFIMCYIVFSFLYVGSCINYLCILRCMYVEQLLLYVLICQVRKGFLIFFFYDINIVYRFKFVCRLCHI